MPRALTPLPPAALWMSGHQGPSPPPGPEGGSTVAPVAGFDLAWSDAMRRIVERTPLSRARRSDSWDWMVSS